MSEFENKDRDGSAQAKGLSGMQRGLIMLGVSLLVLAAAIFCLYRLFVKPPDIQQPEVSEIPAQQEVFVPPVVVETQTQVDTKTGHEMAVKVVRPASHKENFYNILVVGTDDDGTRTDTIMIARIDTAVHSVAIMSIPRDTVIAGNYAVPKINGVYGANGKGESGISALKNKLAQLLGFQVDGYAIVNLNAFVRLVDQVGGVEFDVPMDMDYDDPTQDLYIHLKAGMQHLDGEKAIQLVRFRSGYAAADIRRTQVQQEFLQALAEKCREEIGLADIAPLAEIFKECVMTDLTIGNIAFFGQELRKCDFESMFTYTLQGESVMINKASCYAIYRPNTLDVVNAYFNPYDVQITASDVVIRTPEEIRAEQALLEEAEEETEETEETEEETLPEEELPGEDLFEEVDTEEAAPEEEQMSGEEQPLPESGTEELPTEEPVQPEEDAQLPTDEWVEEPIEDETVVSQ